jgi:hypothetical protein
MLCIVPEDTILFSVSYFVGKLAPKFSFWIIGCCDSWWGGNSRDILAGVSPKELTFKHVIFLLFALATYWAVSIPKKGKKNVWDTGT